MRVARVLDAFALHTPASEDAVGRAEEALGVHFPASYRAFLRSSDGGEGPLGSESYLVLWKTGELAERNAGYHVDDDYAPDLVFIGSDGGNEVLAFRRSDGHFVCAPLIGYAPEDVYELGIDFAESLQRFADLWSAAGPTAARAHAGASPDDDSGP